MRRYKVTFRYIDGNFRECKFSEDEIESVICGIRRAKKQGAGSVLDFTFDNKDRLFIRWDYVTEIEILEVSDE